MAGVARSSDRMMIPSQLAEVDGGEDEAGGFAEIGPDESEGDAPRVSHASPAPGPPEPRVMLQDFAPLAASLEWRVGQSFWSLRGLEAFTTNEVPHLTNNDGMGARRAADVLFASCAEAEARGALEAEVSALEVGVGLGLHARLLLDHFRARCRAEGKDYYQRLTFYAGDASLRTAQDLLARGVFSNHAGRARVGYVDAAAPNVFVDHVTGESVPLVGRLRAAVCNYVLDVLPFTVVRYAPGAVEELRVRTYLRDLSRIHDATALPLERVMALASEGDDEALRALAPLYSYLQLQREFFPVEPDSLPAWGALEDFLARVAEPARAAAKDPSEGVCVTHSYGALGAIESLLRALRPDGFVLLNDYGTVSPDEFAQALVHQRFGGSTAMGLDFPQIEHYLTRQREPAAAVSEPPGDAPHSLHARLITPSPSPEVHEAFRAAFDRAGYAEVSEAMQKGRDAAARNEAAEAVRWFARAHELEPGNWVALLGLGRSLLWGMSNPRRALPVLERGLGINPVASSDLWNEYGDALYLLGRGPDAHEAFLRAIAVNPEDARALLNLAWTSLDRGEFARALEYTGRALGADREGAYESRILKKQSEVLARMRAAQKSEAERLGRRFG